MKVVLTGGAGFIGLAAARALAPSAEILLVDSARRLKRASAGLEGFSTACVDNRCDDLEHIFAGANVLIHLTWSSQPAASMARMVDDADTNILGSLRTFTAAANAGVSRIIFSSSGGTVYGNVRDLPIRETHPTNPISAYGVSKVAVERYLQLIAFHRGLCGISLRIGNPYGPHQFVGVPVGVIAHFILQARRQMPLQIYGDGNIIRDYVWIEDVAQAIAAAAACGAPSGEYNIGSGVGYSLNQVAALVQNALGLSTDLEHVQHRSFDANEVILDIAKSKEHFGWEPSLDTPRGIELMARCAKI